MTFKEIEHTKNVDAREEAVLQYWEENDIFYKSLEKRKSDDDDTIYSFYDGPPFATGLPHYGHLVGSILKDVVPRYWTMRGKYIERRWGWDCHGLPIENIVEKELGSKNKKDIEALGVEKFNNLCRSKVLTYADAWEKIIPRLGRWVDMRNPYRTMDKEYMESVWWVFKELYDQGLIYEDYRSMHICPRCETTLSQSEVTEGYQDVKDLSLIAKFKLQKGQKIAGKAIDDNTYILAWTTTPWTLPGNVALAVGAEISYVVLQQGEERYIVAQERREEIIQHLQDASAEVVARVTGQDLVGLTYEPLYDTYAKDTNIKNHANGWKVVTADFVTTDEGTGIVHIAPAFGEDDMRLGKEKDLPFIQHVGMDGVVEERVEAIGGLHVKPTDHPQATDIEVVKDLASKGLLFHKEKYAHSYPHCWRCDTPLINYATSSWFVAVTKIKERLLTNAQQIHWSPKHMKEGRFGKWLAGARDWSISRQRFWASVIPIWTCDTCDAVKVFGSAKELEDASGQGIDDLHKHIVDKITFACHTCDGVMRRVPDVLDTWFDSGAMPYAQMHYPFEEKEKFHKHFPADFIGEGVDQTRAWFYYLHVLGGALFDSPAFKNVIVNGIVVAEDGKKMSKKLNNYPDPMSIVQKYGADALRLYLMSSQVVAANNFTFNEKSIAELTRGVFRMLLQSYGFFAMYANVDGWQAPQTIRVPKSSHILDRWILARLMELVRDVNMYMEEYTVHKAARLIAPFIDDMSNWYIRRSRKRFWKSEDDTDKGAAYATLYYVLVELSKVMAPFTPFISEELYRNLTQSDSVHMEDFPQADDSLIDEKLLTAMAHVRAIITAGLKLRAQAHIKVRQPLATLVVVGEERGDDFVSIIMEEVNVKDVRFVATPQKDDEMLWNEENTCGLVTRISPALHVEGNAREIIRFIQQARKKAGFDVDDRIVVGYRGMEDVFVTHHDLIAHEVLAIELTSDDIADHDYTETFHVDGHDVTIILKKDSASKTS